MSGFNNIISQFYPPHPTLTEKELQDLTGKVLLITGGYSGVGYQLANLVYAENATVYIAGRRQEEGLRAINEIKDAHPGSTGRLEFLSIDLSDLTDVKRAAQKFLSREDRLDVLWNNAGVMGAPKDVTTSQGYDMQLGTNCIGPFLFTRLLHPLLVMTAKISPPASVRILWAGSLVIHLQAPKTGMDLENLDYRKKDESSAVRYAISKTGNLFIGSEWAKRDSETRVVHLTFNPGNLKTPLQRHMGSIERRVTNLMLQPPIYGAYTELWAGLSPSVKPEDSGRYVIPWGRFGSIRDDISLSLNRIAERGNGKAAAFFKFCENETEKYV